MAAGEFLAYFDSYTSHLFSILVRSTLLIYLGWIIWITCLTSLISGSYLYSAVVDLIAILVVWLGAGMTLFNMHCANPV